MKTKRLKKDSDFFQMLSKGVKEIENGIEIEGYASTKDKDRQRDIVEPWAFKNALKGYMSNPIVLLQHDANKPIGKVTEASIDENGLYIKAQITEDTDWVFSKLKNEVLRAFSIGYRIKDYEIEEEKDVDWYTTDRHQTIKDLELYEISLVSIPANPYALSKSIDWCFEEEEIEEKIEENQETEENSDTETVEEKNEDVKKETVEEVEEKEEKSEEIQNADENSEISPEDSENSVESTENTEETVENTESEVVEETEEPTKEEKSFDFEKKDLMEEKVKSLEIEVKKIDSLKAELEQTKELLKGAIEVIASLDQEIKGVSSEHYSYEKPLSKKGGYSKIVNLLKSI